MRCQLNPLVGRRYVFLSSQKFRFAASIIEPTQHSFPRTRLFSTTSRLQNDLTGKTCLITGGSSGIGLAIAQRFAEANASVHLISRSQSRLDIAQDSILSKLKPSTSTDRIAVETHAGDVSNAEFWTRTATKVPKLDILVNAAGISQSAVLERTQVEEIGNILNANLKGPTLGCKIMAKSLKRGALASNKSAADSGLPKQTSCIINISSLMGLHGGRGASVYAASKAGLIGLTRALADEYGRQGIRVNVVVPGYTETDMIKGESGPAYVLQNLIVESLQDSHANIHTVSSPDFDVSYRDDLFNQIPLKRFATAREIAEAAIFLALNGYTNNCVLNIDGGLSAI